MTDIFKAFAVEKNLAEDGVWVNFIKGVRFKVRSSNGEGFKKTFADYEKKLLKLRKIHRNDIPEDVAKDAYASLLSGMVADWDGVEKDGEKLAFNPANLKEVLKIEQVAKFIATIADDITLFQNDEDDVDIAEEEEKNS